MYKNDGHSTYLQCYCDTVKETVNIKHFEQFCHMVKTKQLLPIVMNIIVSTDSTKSLAY